MSFAPGDELEYALLTLGVREFGHFSYERILSGGGLQWLHGALCKRNKRQPGNLDAASIVRAAQAGMDAHCFEATRIFSRVLGSFAGNIALVYGSTGGLYLCGGAILGMGTSLDEAAFRGRFEAKGRYQSYLSQIPTMILTAPYPAISGMARILEARAESRPDP